MENPKFNVTPFFKKNEKSKFPKAIEDKIQKGKEEELQRIINDSVDFEPENSLNERVKEKNFDPAIHSEISMTSEAKMLSSQAQTINDLIEVQSKIDDSIEMKNYRQHESELILKKSELKNLENKRDEDLINAITKNKQNAYKNDINKKNEAARMKELKVEIKKLEDELENLEKKLDPKLIEQKKALNEEIERYKELTNAYKDN